MGRRRLRVARRRPTSTCLVHKHSLVLAFVSLALGARPSGRRDDDDTTIPVGLRFTPVCLSPNGQLPLWGVSRPSNRKRALIQKKPYQAKNKTRLISVGKLRSYETRVVRDRDQQRITLILPRRPQQDGVA